MASFGSFGIGFRHRYHFTIGGFRHLLHYCLFHSPQLSWGFEFVNQNVESGKLLLLCDSYGYVVVPFLSGAVHEITTVIMRDFDGDLLQLIQDNDYDAVVVLYAGFMIGAHDNPNSANYKMFAFDPSL